MVATYVPLFMLFLVGGLLTIVFFVVTPLLGKKNPTPEKMIPYECGSETTGGKHVKLSVKFYLTAILFVIFDVAACCGMEFFSMTSPRYDVSRFGAEAPRFSPRQSDLLWVVGTISQRQAPVLKRIYEQMLDPKWVLAFGTCASCGGFYDNYTTLPGVDKVIPCDIYVPGCPPRPEAVIDGLLLLQDKIARGDRTPGIVKPRTDPVPGREALIAADKLHQKR